MIDDSSSPPDASGDKPVTLKLAVRASPFVDVPILHEDPDLLIINKPVGMVVQPGKGHTVDTLLNGLFATHGKLLHNLGERRDYGLLHRIDRETSGLLVVAKSPNAYDQLRRDFEARRVDKEYLTIVQGVPKPLQGVIQARLKEVQIANPDGRGSMKKVVITRQGQEAVSAYKTASQSEMENQSFSMVRVDIKTGRLHQIRAHMTFLNCQVMGDTLYSPAIPFPPVPRTSVKSTIPRAPRLALHSWHLGFKHPIQGKWVHFYAPLPEDLARFAAKLGLDAEVADKK